MSSRDPIVDELHRLRERIGRAHDFDVDRIAATIRRHEREAGLIQEDATPARRGLEGHVGRGELLNTSWSRRRDEALRAFWG